MKIERNVYLNKIIDRKENGLIKIVTGIRRCGKSYLLDPIFKEHLIANGVKEDHIIKLDLDERRNSKYLDPDVLDEYIRNSIKDKEMYYVLLDEIQKVEDFEAVLNGFLHIENLDVYVTGSNSKFLSSDIITEFRGRGDEIKVYPLTYGEFYSAFSGDKANAWDEYIMYGGLPRILSFKTEEQKSEYLKNLFEQTYLKDIIERKNIQRIDVLDALVNILASSIGSLTNPNKLSNTFESNNIKDVSVNTITTYVNYLLDAFLISKAERYDVKGKKYISTPSKYYFTDIGLRNCRLNFRQQEESRIMENILYNELLYRGYNVDVGVVEIREKDAKKQIEVDFVCNQYNKRYYVQSALSLETREKTIQEERPLMNIQDNFKKIIVVKDNIKPWITEEGISVVGIQEFLLNKDSMNL
ncbi:MAG: ATP-binding protein [Clostridia bacterium]|nr:ATP-binding protein [Clostridia bacterium]